MVKSVFSKIYNPKTKRMVNVNGVVGRKILKKYMNNLRGGTQAQKDGLQEATRKMNMLKKLLNNDQIHNVQRGLASDDMRDARDRAAELRREIAQAINNAVNKESKEFKELKENAEQADQKAAKWWFQKNWFSWAPWGN